jgi:NADH-quinone oxidoreductase subunit J
VLLGAEFLAMILVVVYVGAVAVLFLFVVMMLDVDFAELRAGFIKNAPLGAAVGLIMLAELVLMIGFYFVTPAAVTAAAAPMPPVSSGVTNTEAIGRLLYTKYVYFFQGAGLILLVAMIGAIVLTLRHKEGVKRQSIASQVARGKGTAIDVVKIAPGTATVPPAAE